MDSTTLLLLVVVAAVAFIAGRLTLRRAERSAQSARQPIANETTLPGHGLGEFLAAIEARDGEAVEALRGAAVGNWLHDLVDYYQSLTDWDRKDLVIGLVCDYYDSVLHPIYSDALSSPSIDTRALAVSGLSGDAILFESLVVNGRVDASRTAAAVEAYRASKAIGDG